MQKKNLLNTSKYMSYILRHNPNLITEKLGIKNPIDNEGYVFVDDLLKVLNIDFNLLKNIVDTDNKQRYSFNNDLSKIRANQGHSINEISISFNEIEPYTDLYHGTSSHFLSEG
jgi:putative RNA 2'-phosphotransferase